MENLPEDVSQKNMDYATRSHRNGNIVRKNESIELSIVPETGRAPSGGEIRKKQNFGGYFRDGKRKIDFVLVYETSEDAALDIRRDTTDKKHDSKHLRRNYFENNLEKEGVELESEFVTESGKTLVFVKIHCPWLTLCRLAEQLELKMPLQIFDDVEIFSYQQKRDTRYKRYCKKFINLLNKKEISNDEDSKDATFEPCRLHKPFSLDSVEHFYIDLDNKEQFFPDCFRIEIAHEILHRAHNNPSDDKKRGIHSLLDKGIYHTAFPLHNGSIHKNAKNHIVDIAEQLSPRQKLFLNWASWTCIFQAQPLRDVRLYFGEKIGFYFAFMDFYTKALIFPAILGFTAFIYGIIFTALSVEMRSICDRNSRPGSFWMCPICQPPDCDPWLMAEEGCFKYKWQFRLDNVATFLIACFTTLWSIIFLKLWKRRESRLAVEWESLDAEEHVKTIRPEYEATASEERYNPITLEPEKIVPFSTISVRMTASVCATIIMLILDGIFLVVLVISRIALYKALNNLGSKHIAYYNVEYGRWIVHGFILITILIFEKIYLTLARKLTSFECPKTDKKYMASLLWKLFIFQMLNDFVPIAYAAWMKQTWVSTPLDLNFVSELCDGGCMAEVAELIAVLLLARLVIGNMQEVVVPYLRNLRSERQHKSTKSTHHGQKIQQWLEDFKLNEVELDGVYEEYMEMMVQFAFIVLFTPAFPIASLICFGNNILEIRVDATKLLKANRRPVPLRVSGIRIWNKFLDIIVKVGIVCNAALIGFTSDTVPHMYYKYLELRKVLNYTGYTEFSLSSVEVGEWLTSSLHREENITRCYYQDFRESEPPYNLKTEEWIISTARVAVFSLYSIVFLLAMWLCNTFVDDVPEDVQNRVKRHVFLMSTKSVSVDSTTSASSVAIRSDDRKTFGIEKNPRKRSVSRTKSKSSISPDSRKIGDDKILTTSELKSVSSVPNLPPINQKRLVSTGILT